MQTVFSQRLLAGLQARTSEEKDRDDTFQDPDDRKDPDDLSPRLVVTVAEPKVEKIYTLPALPSPLPSALPSSFWTPLLFGNPGDAVSLEDARLALALIEARSGEGRIAALNQTRSWGNCERRKRSTADGRRPA
jgi:hypothetical protein